MPAAVSIPELLAICDKEYSKLTRVIADLSEEDAMMPGSDGISIKDTIGHRMHWVELYLCWVRDGRAGQDVQTPAPGYKWSELKAYNAQLRQAQADLDWESAKAGFAEAHGRLMAFLQEETEDSLYTPQTMPWLRNWTLGRWAEASGASHYRSATKYIRKLLRDRSG